MQLHTDYGRATATTSQPKIQQRYEVITNILCESNNGDRSAPAPAEMRWDYIRLQREKQQGLPSVERHDSTKGERATAVTGQQFVRHKMKLHTT